jgi:hypothetical protein
MGVELPRGAPEPTELQRDFIKASEAEDARKKSAEAEHLRRLEEALARANRNEAAALTALAKSEAEQHPVKAAKLALATWPRDDSDMSLPQATRDSGGARSHRAELT